VEEKIELVGEITEKRRKKNKKVGVK